MLLGERTRPLVSPVRDDRHFYPFAQQTAQRELGRVSRAQYHRATARQTPKDFFCYLNSRGANRCSATADTGLSACARCRQQRGLKHSIEQWSGLGSTLIPGGFYLAVDLSFSENHR